MEEEKKVTLDTLNEKTLEQSKVLFNVAMADMPFAKDVHEVEPIDDESGFPLDKLDEYDNEFKKMYEDMFSRLNEFGTISPGEFEMKLIDRQNEFSRVMTEKGNEGCIGLTSSGQQTIHASEHPTAPVHNTMSVTSTGTIVHPVEEGSSASDSRVDE